MNTEQPYRQTIHLNLPYAQIMADRFYVMKQFTERLDQMRRSRNKPLRTNQAERVSRGLF